MRMRAACLSAAESPHSFCPCAEDVEARLEALKGALALDEGAVRQAALRNPALLLAPLEPLLRKLTLLGNATGISPAKAAEMVTVWMF